MRISDWSSDVCSSDLVHQPQAVAVAVEGDAEVAALPQHGFLKLPQVLGHRGNGMVIGKAAVDLRIEQDVFAAKARGDRCPGLAHRAVPGIPRDLQHPPARAAPTDARPRYEERLVGKAGAGTYKIRGEPQP